MADRNMAAAAAAAADEPMYQSVSTLSDVLRHSGAVVELEVARCWDVRTEEKTGRRVLRLEARDFRAKHAHQQAPAAGVLPASTPIEVFLHGLWAGIPISRLDVLCIRYPLVERAAGDADHPWQLVLTDEGPTAEASTLRVRGWKDKLLRREGREYTTEMLQRQQDEAEEAAAREAEEIAAAAAAAAAEAAASKQKAAVPPGKKQRVSRTTASADEFTTVAALIAAGSASTAAADSADAVALAAPSSKRATTGKKRKTGASIHGAYAYTPLSEAEYRPREKLNVYGVVIQSRTPAKTKGTDRMWSVVVADMSLPLHEHATINIFRPSDSAFPPPGSVQPGDIIRLHRAEIDRFTGTGKLVGKLVDKSTSFILLRGQPQPGEHPMQPYFNPNHTCSEIDEDIVNALRQWAPRLEFRTGAAAASTPAANDSAFASSSSYSSRYPSHTIAELDRLPKAFFDMYCAVVHTDPSGTFVPHPPQTQQGQTQAGGRTLAPPPAVPLAYVWDGTDLPSTIRFQRPLLPNGIHLPLPGHATADSSQSALPFAPPVPMSPRWGSILPLALPQPGMLERFLPPKGAAGKPFFVKLRNVPLAAGPDGSGHYMHMTRLSHVDVLPSSDPHVVRMMQAYAARQAREQAILKLQHWSALRGPSLVAPAETLVPLTTIKCILMDENGGAGKYRVRARVLSISPHPAAPAAESLSASAAAADESKEGEAAAPEPEPGAVPVQPLESVCKLFCSRCSAWSACSATASAVEDSCASCGGAQGGLSYGYFLSLLLHDATGTLPVLLCGSEADELFVGLPAGNLHSSTTSAKFVRQRLARLLAPGSLLDVHVLAYDVPHDAPPPLSASQLTGSQAEFLSQDLAAFFAPAMPGQATMDDDAAGDAEGANRPAQQMRRVFRITGAIWNLSA